jgi:hypothetical protein
MVYSQVWQNLLRCLWLRWVCFAAAGAIKAEQPIMCIVLSKLGMECYVIRKLDVATKYILTTESLGQLSTLLYTCKSPKMSARLTRPRQ